MNRVAPAELPQLAAQVEFQLPQVPDHALAKSLQFLRIVEKAERLQLFHAFHHVSDLGCQIGVAGKASAQVPGFSQAMLEFLFELAGLSGRQGRGWWQLPVAEIDRGLAAAPACLSLLRILGGHRLARLRLPLDTFRPAGVGRLGGVGPGRSGRTFGAGPGLQVRNPSLQ